ncbi:hypothetical protein G6O69_26730 [Pseudenhygromyxa sp. WMMC2535]|uniref:S26 family signal peptidase n=1 Tax=Pseudenhygromyxa sp. WMMC2535 TaxID=2712867 RepID=UPI001595A8DA|nr:S26 family signal peptidase [Pseudenhygromyxa sp. WMMC2535]NVB41462.1 hypothetical protein [Pseudenhygromyxa sp. WMMC2535]
MSRPCARCCSKRQPAPAKTMFGRRDDDYEDERRPRGRQRSWSTRIAAAVLLGGVGLIFTRATLATLLQIHGDGMAPTILDGESVMMVRGGWGIEAGDIVVYDPTPTPLAFEPPDEPQLADDPLDGPSGPSEGERIIDPDRLAEGELRNTAVVDVDDVESNWQRVRERGQRDAPRNFRVGRVLAVPGDTVTFNVPDASLGLAVNGRPLAQKLIDPMRLILAGQPVLGEDQREVDTPKLRTAAWETLGDARYPVLPSSVPPTWTGMALPGDLGPIELQAEGYLILADNRDEGACCDSRELGWVPADKLRGEVVLRLAGDPGAAPDSDPRSRGLAWLP